MTMEISNQILTMLESEIQLQYAKLSEMKGSAFETLLLFLGVLVSIAITSSAEEIGLSWFLLGLIIIILLSFHYFVTFRLKFVTDNDRIFKSTNDKKNLLTNRLLFKCYKGIKFPFLLGFCFALLVGLMAIFALPTAYTQLTMIFESLQQNFGIYIVLLILLIIIGIGIDDGIRFLKLQKEKKKTGIDPLINFSTRLTRNSEKIKNISLNYVIVSILIFPIIYTVIPSLTPVKFGFEVIMIVILFLIWGFSIQIVNNKNTYELEFNTLIFLEKIKNQLVFKEKTDDEVLQLFACTKVLTINQIEFLQFFSFYYYSLDCDLIEKIDNQFLNEFIDIIE